MSIAGFGKFEVPFFYIFLAKKKHGGSAFSEGSGRKLSGAPFEGYPDHLATGERDINSSSPKEICLRRVREFLDKMDGLSWGWDIFVTNLATHISVNL